MNQGQLIDLLQAQAVQAKAENKEQQQALKNQIKHLEVEILELQHDKKYLREEKDEIQKTVRKSNKEREELQRSLAQLREEKETLQEAKKQADSDKKETRRAVRRLEAEKDTMQDEKNALEEEAKENKKARSRLEKENEDLKKTLTKLREETAELQKGLIIAEHSRQTAPEPVKEQIPPLPLRNAPVPAAPVALPQRPQRNSSNGMAPGSSSRPTQIASGFPSKQSPDSNTFPLPIPINRATPIPIPGRPPPRTNFQTPPITPILQSGSRSQPQAIPANRPGSAYPPTVTTFTSGKIGGATSLGSPNINRAGPSNSRPISTHAPNKRDRESGYHEDRMSSYAPQDKRPRHGEQLQGELWYRREL